MRADHQRLERRIAARSRAHDVSRGVNRHFQFGVAHERHDVLAPLEVGVAIGDTTHSTLRILAELRQRLEVRRYSRSLDA